MTFFDLGIGGPNLRLGYDCVVVAVVFLLLGWELGWQEIRYFWLSVPLLIHYFYVSATPSRDLGFRMTFDCVMLASLTYILGRAGRKIFGGGAKLSRKIFRHILKAR